MEWLGCGLDMPSFIHGRASDKSLIQSVQTASGAHPTCSVDTGGLCPGMKRPGREADYTAPSSADVKNERRYNSTLPICLRGVYRDSFTFT